MHKIDTTLNAAVHIRAAMEADLSTLPFVRTADHCINLKTQAMLLAQLEEIVVTVESLKIES